MTRPPNQQMPWKAFGLTWLGLVGMLIAAYLGRIASRDLFDPDDFMRLAQVRDLLGGQSWFDLSQHRLNPPGGTPMHWSRLVDAPLALLIAGLTPLLGAHSAETVTMVLVPMLTLGCVLALAMRIAVRFFARDVAVLCALGAVLVPATLIQLVPLRIDHHGWQIASVLLAAASPLLVRSANRAAALAGLAMALGLTISLEPLPLAAAFGAVFAWSWLRDPAGDQRLAWYMSAFAAGLALLFLITRGPQALQPWCDVIAPAHIALFAVLSLGIALASAFAPPRPTYAVAALALSTLAGLATFANLAPACIGAPLGQMDPLVYGYWYRNISEGMPLWHQTPGTAAASAVPALLALGALLSLWRKAGPEDKAFLREYLVLFCAALLTGLMVWRSMAFAGALGGLGLGWLINRVLTWARQDSADDRRHGLPWRYLSLFAAAAACGAVLLWPAAPETSQDKPVARLTGGSSGCDLPRSTALLDRLPRQTIFAPLDIGPQILVNSHHAVVASSHHRANLAIRDVMSAFLADQAKAQPIVVRHGATLLVYCEDVTEAANYAHDAPGGLMADLKAGRVPAWLEPVNVGAPPAFRVYRVRQP